MIDPEPGDRGTWGEGRLREVADALPVLLSFVDAAQRYRFVSAAYERWFGRPRASLLGRTLEQVLGAEAYARVRPHAERALAGETVTYVAEVPYALGGTRYVEATYVPRQGPDGAVEGFAALVADITERRAFERFRLATAARDEQLLAITAALADAVTPEQVQAAIVDRVAEALSASSVGLFLVSEDGEAVELARHVGYRAETARALARAPLEAEPSIPALDVIRSRRALWIDSRDELLARYPHLRGLVTPGASYRVSCLPLVVHDRVLGALGITSERHGGTTDEERAFLRLIARYAAQALERLRLLEAERRSRAVADDAARWLGALSDASRALVEAGVEVEARLEVVARTIGAALDGCVAITLVRAGRLHAVAVHHPDPVAAAALRATAWSSPPAVGSGVAGQVALTGTSALVPEVTPAAVDAADAPIRAFLSRHPIHSLAAAPLRARGEVVGVVSVGRLRPDAPYGPSDLRLLEEVADRAGVAIENGRLFDEARAARRRAEELYRFAQAVVSAEDVDAVASAALDRLDRAIGAARAVVLARGHDGLLRPLASRGLSPALRAALEGHAPWPEGVEPAPLRVEDVRTDPHAHALRAVLEAEGVAAYLAVPLRIGGRALGALVLYDGQPRAFETHEVETAQAIAHHLASVMVRFAASAKLEQTVRASELFAGVLAHDLRNPLGAILTGAQLLLVQDPSGATAKVARRILASGTRMTRMIDQLLDLTRARTGGGIEVVPTAADLGAVCAQVVEELELANPTWQIRRSARGDLSGRWDVDRLHQVVSNLVGNAGRHGLPGRPVDVALDGDHVDHVVLTVRNDGTIPPARLDDLFDPFRRARVGHGRSEGLGLGLFIVRELVHAHGGRVTVTSSDEAGTTFRVELPRQRPLRRLEPPAGDGNGGTNR